MKKGYKRLQRRLLNEIYKRIGEEQQHQYYKAVAECAKDEADYYKERFRELGSNVETVDTDGDVMTIKWELTPKQFGNYITVGDAISITPEIERLLITKLSDSLAKAMVEGNIAQIIKKVGLYDDPITRYGTIGVKLYVVPWEQMPHKRTIELQQEVEKCLDIPPVSG